MPTNFQIVMRELADAFETRKRDDGTSFTKLRDVRPGWIEDASLMYKVHAAVDGRMPDDWIYESAASIARGFVDYACEDSDSAQDASCEIADSNVDIYTGSLIQWLASHLRNVSLCDEAIEEGLCSEDADLVKRISLGQYIALQRIAGAIIALVIEEAERRDNATEESEAV